MRIFDFDPADHRADYEADGWVHIPGGVTAEFHELLLDYAREELGEHMLEGFAIKGKKEQSLFEFPEGVDYPDEVFDVIAALCGLNRATMTLSERHIQAYETSAAPEPAAHKDRFPSQVSVGLSIAIPEDSRLVLYPHDHRALNPYNTSAGFRRSLQPDELPEVALRDAREVEIDDQDRDVVVFPGSTTWHLRRRSASSINLYLKLNDFDCDPLGEDPHTAGRRAATLDAVASVDRGDAHAYVPVLARRLDTVARTYTRAGWEQEGLEAQVFGEEPFGLTSLQLEALQAVDGKRSLGELARSITNGTEAGRAQRELVWLAERGALDLLPATATDAAPVRSGVGGSLP